MLSLTKLWVVVWEMGEWWMEINNQKNKLLITDKNQLGVTNNDNKKIEKEIILFSFSSLICFFIDYTIYSLIFIQSSNIIISNIIARIISSIINFSINKNIVFKEKTNFKKQIIKYFSLVIINLLLNTTLLKLISKIINPYISKLLTELILFISSYIIQKNYIFKGSDEYKKQ